MRVSQAVRKKAQGLIAETWQSQANLSLFLLLEILIAFMLPSLGFGKEDIQLYSDIGFSDSADLLASPSPGDNGNSSCQRA